MAKKMTLPVWTLANTPPRTKKVCASMKPLVSVSSSANHSVLDRSVSSRPIGEAPIRTTYGLRRTTAPPTR